MVQKDDSDSITKLSVHEDDVLNISNITVIDRDADKYKSNIYENIQALVSVSHGGKIEIQSVETTAYHIDQIQSVYIAAVPYESDTIIGGTFKLAFDLNVFGLGVAETEDIYFNAVGLISEERTGSSLQGGDLHQSMQSKLNSIPQFHSLGVTVQVEVQKQLIGAAEKPRFGVPDVEDGDFASFNGRRWKIFFRNASYEFPLMSIVSNNLVTNMSGNTEISARMDNPGNKLGGMFQLEMSGEVTPPHCHSI